MSRVENVEVLLKHGADVNLRPPKIKGRVGGGISAAECAALFGRFDSLELLLAHGASDLDAIALTVQLRRWPEIARPQVIDLLRRLHARGAKIYASSMNPDTPAELLTPGDPPAGPPAGEERARSR